MGKDLAISRNNEVHQASQRYRPPQQYGHHTSHVPGNLANTPTFQDGGNRVDSENGTDRADTLRTTIDAPARIARRPATGRW